MTNNIHITYLPVDGIEETELTRILGEALKDAGIKKFAVIPEDQQAEVAKLNSKIRYTLRDCDGCMIPYESIIMGRLSEKQIDTICSCLKKGKYFSPARIGLNADQCFFAALDQDSFYLTTEQPTSKITPDELVDRFVREKIW